MRFMFKSTLIAVAALFCLCANFFRMEHNNGGPYETDVGRKRHSERDLKALADKHEKHQQGEDNETTSLLGPSTARPEPLREHLTRSTSFESAEGSLASAAF